MLPVVGGGSLFVWTPIRIVGRTRVGMVRAVLCVACTVMKLVLGMLLWMRTPVWCRLLTAAL